MSLHRHDLIVTAQLTTMQLPTTVLTVCMSDLWIPIGCLSTPKLLDHVTPT